MNTTNMPPPPPATLDEECRTTSFNIDSPGFWENFKSPTVIFGYPLPLLEMQVLLIFTLISASHMVLRCIGIPQIVSQMIAGLILGPQLIGLIQYSSRKLSSFDPALDGNATLDCVAALGCMIFVFLMTVKTNTRVAFRNGKLPVVIAFVSIFTPLFIGFSFRNFLSQNINPRYMEREKALSERSVIITFQSLTLLPVITSLLSDLKILNSELGRLATSAAVISDFIGIFLLVLVSFAGTYRHVSPAIACRELAAFTIYILVVIFVLRPAAEWIVNQTPEGKPVRKLYINAIILTVLGSSAYTTFFSQQLLIGPLLFGLVVPDGPPLGSALEAKFEKVVKNILLPVFITVSVMKGNVMRFVFDFHDICYNIFLVVLTLIVKWAASLAPCLYYKLPLRDSAALAFIMSCKGFSELFLYSVAREKTGITQATHTFMMIYILLNAGIIPMVVGSLYDPKRKYIGYHNRDIMHLKPNSELRILTCLHKPDNISSTIGFLQLLSPSGRRTPLLAVTVLHLAKLVGRAFPFIISHKKRHEGSIQNTYIETAMLTFNQFEQENWGSVTVATFSAFSPENLMHEDVCQLALNQQTSMIVVPSCRRWSIDGSFECDDETIRSLNLSLLDRAPCSIGILVDRGELCRRGNLKNKKGVSGENRHGVALIFIGGKDDREALSLAKRMKQNPGVDLTVIRFISDQATKFTNWEDVLDHEVLKDLKQGNVGGDNSISYVEKIVNGGIEVAVAVRSLAKEYHLLIVGRHHRAESLEFSGLSEWMELPELGVLGDFLATKDTRSRVSVLVVQQKQEQV